MKCKFCGREMRMSGIQFQSNQYCNKCFDDRVAAFKNDKQRYIILFDKDNNVHFQPLNIAAQDYLNYTYGYSRR